MPNIGHQRFYDSLDINLYVIWGIFQCYTLCYFDVRGDKIRRCDHLSHFSFQQRIRGPGIHSSSQINIRSTSMKGGSPSRIAPVRWLYVGEPWQWDHPKRFISVFISGTSWFIKYVYTLKLVKVECPIAVENAVSFIWHRICCDTVAISGGPHRIDWHSI